MSQITVKIHWQWRGGANIVIKDRNTREESYIRIIIIFIFLLGQFSIFLHIA